MFLRGRAEGVLAGLVVGLAVGAGLAGCGWQDDGIVARGGRELHDKVRYIVDEAQADNAPLITPTLDQFEGAVVRRVPSEPDGHQLFIRPGENGTRLVGFAVDGKVDGYGRGETRSIRMCVVVTLTITPRVDAKIADTDCGDLRTRADFVIPYDG